MEGFNGLDGGSKRGSIRISSQRVSVVSQTMDGSRDSGNFDGGSGLNLDSGGRSGSDDGGSGVGMGNMGNGLGNMLGDGLGLVEGLSVVGLGLKKVKV